MSRIAVSLPPPPERPRTRRSGLSIAASVFWIRAFVVLQLGCQLALLVPGLGPFRVLVRIAAFAVSLVFLILLRGRGKPHPAAPVAVCILAILGLELLHPSMNTAVSGVAQFGLSVSILAPVFWASRLPIDPPSLTSILRLVWLFHTVSAGFGVLQVQFPGRFQPNLSAAIVSKGEGYVQTLQIETATGQRVFRPMGLTDIPGGGGVAGFYAGLFGLGFFLIERRFWRRMLAVASMLLGVTCLYLCQVRTLFVLFFCCAVILSGFLAWRGELRRLAVLAVVVAGVTLAGLAWTLAVGGERILNRLETLVEGNPAEVYYQNRGIFLEHTFEKLLPIYPLGAGLGRWGMTNVYFGDNSNPETAVIPGVEIQWMAWLVDGGVPLMVIYGVALVVTVWTAFRIAASRTRNELWLWAAVLLAYDLGACVNTFTYPLFIGQSGLEFWLLNGLLFAASQNLTPVRLPMPGPRR